jgi:ACS family hexuronate transporter-like MFS transporter
LLASNWPQRNISLSEEEREYIIGGQEAQHQTNNGKKMSVWQILGTRQFWGIALPRFLAEPAWGTFNAWIPLFMFKVYGFNLKEIAMFAWMPMLFADLGCIVGGYLPPLFQRALRPSPSPTIVSTLNIGLSAE